MDKGGALKLFGVKDTRQPDRAISDAQARGNNSQRLCYRHNDREENSLGYAQRGSEWSECAECLWPPFYRLGGLSRFKKFLAWA